MVRKVTQTILGILHQGPGHEPIGGAGGGLIPHRLGHDERLYSAAVATVIGVER
jgi:hypothetical protein